MGETVAGRETGEEGDTMGSLIGDIYAIISVIVILWCLLAAFMALRR